MKKETIFLIATMIIILLIAAFFSGSYYVKYKERKQQECLNLGFQQTAIQITNTGNIPIVVNNSIQWFPIRNFCE